MRPIALLRYVTKAMTERKLRATLTILGIVIGPATIVSLVGATQGYSAASTAQFSNLGATTLFLSPVGRGTTLTTTTVGEIQNLTGVSAVVPYQSISGTITQGGESVSVQIVAVDFSQLPSVFPSLTLGQGSTPASSDAVGAVIGYSIAYPDLEGATNTTLNQVVTVSGLGRTAFTVGGAGGTSSSQAQTKHSFVVSGIYDEFGQGFGISPDTSIFIPLASGELILHSVDYSGIMVVASSASTVSEVTSELTTDFGNDIRITSISSLLSSIQSVTSGTATLLEAVGGTSVLVAFIGIMTTMLTSVLERTKEIGVLKALGSSSRGIMSVFLAEAALTGLIGGLIGVGAGYMMSFVVIGALSGTLHIPSIGGGGGARVVSGAGTTGAGGGGAAAFGGGGRGGGAALATTHTAAAAATTTSSAASAASSTLSITPVITPELMGLAILLAVAVGTFGGLIPAWRASRLNAVEALRRS